jgi:DNA-binding response OmpR family regulator
MYDILIVDDDTPMLDMLEFVLKREGYQVQRASSAHRVLELIADQAPDLFVIDIMMPEVDGMSLCRTLRRTSNTARTPIIVLTGAPGQYGVVDVLAAGADDYVRKPFAPRELAARIRALIRRTAQLAEVDAPQLRLVPSSCRVYIGEREVTLTRVEFDLLRFLARAPFQAFSAEDLLMRVWRYPQGVGDSALVRNHVRNVRRKIEADPERPLILQSRHGRGYMVKARVQIEDERIARMP